MDRLASRVLLVCFEEVGLALDHVLEEHEQLVLAPPHVFLVEGLVVSVRWLGPVAQIECFLEGGLGQGTRLGSRILRDRSDGIVLEAARQGLADLDVRHLLEDIRDDFLQLGQLFVCLGALLEDQLEHPEFACRGLDSGGCCLG